MSIILRRPLLDMHTRLSEIPEDWLKYIEPKIMRGSFLPCWVWTGGMDKYGYPMVRHPMLRASVMAHRYVASMFWEFPDHYFVTRTCHRINCLCPGHLVVQAEHPRWSPPVGR
jgi:hypothetical protein